MERQQPVVVSVEGDDVLVSDSAMLRNRASRLYFGTVLGARPTQDGWACPRRRVPLADLVVRINTWLERRGWTVDRRGIADEAVERDIERRRSFERTRERAGELREDGKSTIDMQAVVGELVAFGWDESARKLKDYQKSGLVHGLTAINAANFSVPGSGKTATTLAIAATHLHAGTVDFVLVVGPLSCFAPWEKETSAALPGKLHVKRVRGTSSQRREVYDSVATKDVLLLSYASAAADAQAIIQMCRTRPVMLVVDESHRIKRFRGGMWAPALVRIARYARVKIVLSGTPMPQSGKDLYSQLSVLWPGQELTGPRDAFGAAVDRDFSSVLKLVHPFLSRTPKDALGLPPYSVHRHSVPLGGTQAEIYDLIEGNFRRRLEDARTYQDKISALRRGRPIRLLQAASNPELLNKSDSQFQVTRLSGGNPTLMERLAGYSQLEVPAKSLFGLDLVRQVTEASSKVVVWSNFISNLDHFAQMVRTATGLPCFQVDGRLPVGDESVFDADAVAAPDERTGETRERTIDAFLSLDGAAVLVANPASCSESISLHSACHTAIYLDRTYDCALYLQSIDRIHRLGLREGANVNVHILLGTIDGRMTVDGLVDQALQRKEQTMKQLLEGAELRPWQLAENPATEAEGDGADLAALLNFLLGKDQ